MNTISLDISTTTIGIAIEYNGSIISKQFDANKIKKEFKKSNLTDFNLYNIIANRLIASIKELAFDNIIIEQPLFNSANRSTVNKLIIINTIISTLLSNKYNKEIIHQNVNTVRSWFLKKLETDKELDKKTRTIETINKIYGYNLTLKDNDAADAIMHLLYFNEHKYE